MKIDTDPVKNREQLGKLRSFSVLNMLIVRKGFWFFMGIIFLVASVLIFFGDPIFINGGTKEEISVTFFALGSGIILLTILISYLLSKISEYIPTQNIRLRRYPAD